MKIQQAETAIDNFHSSHFKYQILQRQEGEIIERMQPGKDYTITELAYITKLEKSSVSGRRNAMLKKGLIMKGIKRKCLFTEITCQTVKLPEARHD